MHLLLVQQALHAGGSIVRNKHLPFLGRHAHCLPQCARYLAQAQAQASRTGVVAAAAAAAAGVQQQPPSPEDKARVAATLDRAQQLEYNKQEGEALELLRQELASQQLGFWRRGSRMLRQRVCHLLFTAGDTQAALEEGAAVYEEICRESGEESGEAVLFGLRLGIIEAAAGQLGSGRQRIYKAGTWIAPKLHQMVQQQQQEGGQGTPLPDMAVRRLSETLNEVNLWGSMFAIRDMAQQGEAYDVLEKWESLDAGVTQCFTYLLLALPPGAHTVTNALREHNRLVEDLGRHPLLGERLQQQSLQLQEAVEKAGLARQ